MPGHSVDGSHPSPRASQRQVSLTGANASTGSNSSPSRIFSPALSIRLREDSMRGMHGGAGGVGGWRAEDTAGLQRANSRPTRRVSEAILPEYSMVARRVTDAVLQKEIHAHSSGVTDRAAPSSTSTDAQEPAELFSSSSSYDAHRDGGVGTLASLEGESGDGGAEAQQALGSVSDMGADDTAASGCSSSGCGEPSAAAGGASVALTQSAVSASAGSASVRQAGSGGAGAIGEDSAEGTMPARRGGGNWDAESRAGASAGAKKRGGGTAAAGAGVVAMGASAELDCSGKILAHRLEGSDGTSEEGVPRAKVCMRRSSLLECMHVYPQRHMWPRGSSQCHSVKTVVPDSLKMHGVQVQTRQILLACWNPMFGLRAPPRILTATGRTLQRRPAAALTQKPQSEAQQHHHPHWALTQLQGGIRRAGGAAARTWKHRKVPSSRAPPGLPLTPSSRHAWGGSGMVLLGSRCRLVAASQSACALRAWSRG